MTPPVADREHMAGNHVILECDGIHVVLAHLRKGSTCVAAGDTVAAGALLGEVGNSGNTAEPHLHIHAQRPGTEAEPLSGDPLPIRLDGRSLARNARIDP
jgi:murein DD-endopeptidase MepM/ murein hydrolase activator NlpD